MSSRKNNVFENIVGWTIGIPIVIVFALLISPFLIYKLAIDEPVQNRRKRKFLAERQGLIVLCVTSSVRYKFIDQVFRDGLTAKGISRIAVFDGSIPNNQFDNFIWDNLINRSQGFPQLLRVTKDGIEAIALKEDFAAYFKKEIDQAQLIGSIVWKLNHNEWKQTL